MLVLTRKLGENIIIDDEISIRVVSIDSNKVQLGIQAPNDVMIYRQELVDRIKSQNRSSVVRKKWDLVSAARNLKILGNVRY
jgi:carbon storage regulator